MDFCFEHLNPVPIIRFAQDATGQVFGHCFGFRVSGFEFILGWGEAESVFPFP